MTQNDTEVPVAPKKYKGKLVLNTNVGKKMHLIAKYYTFSVGWRVSIQMPMIHW